MRHVSRLRRLASGAILVATGLLATTGCTHEGLPPPSIETADGYFWMVVVENPRFDGVDTCGRDPAVKIGVLSADTPPSAYRIELKNGTTEDDANRIAACLEESLESGVIIVSGP